jgi:SAM-dependent methyltransferase
MVDQYNTRVSNQGIPREEMHAVCADLQGTADELDGGKFDLVVVRPSTQIRAPTSLTPHVSTLIGDLSAIQCASSYHHFASINDVTRTLAFFLKPNGVLLVIDLLKSDDAETEDIFPDHPHHVVAHKGGFKEDDLRTAFQEAGLTAFMFNDAMSVKRGGHDLKLFIAKGTKIILAPGQIL